MALPLSVLAPHIAALLERLVPHAGGREICGLVAVNPRGEQRFVRLRNLAEGEGSFIVDEMEMDRVSLQLESAGWRIAALLHTHQQSARLSSADRVTLETSQMPWVIVVPRAPGIETAFYHPRAAAE